MSTAAGSALGAEITPASVVRARFASPPRRSSSPISAVMRERIAASFATVETRANVRATSSGPLRRGAELDVAPAELVVGGVDAERLLEGLERALLIAELVLLEDADAAKHVAAARAARVLELDAEVARALLGGRRAGRERCGRARGEALALEEARRDASCVGVRGVDLEERLDVRHRALRLLQLVREDVDQLRADAACASPASGGGSAASACSSMRATSR